MRVLSVDPGFERLGLAVLEKTPQTKKEILIFSECFKTKSSLLFPERLNLIGKRVRELISEHKPDILAIETLFFSGNQKTAMRVAESRGVILYEASRADLEIREFTPLQIKIAVAGYGRADKDQVKTMVEKLISLPKRVVSDDEMDAIAIGLTSLSIGRDRSR